MILLERIVRRGAPRWRVEDLPGPKLGAVDPYGFDVMPECVRRRVGGQLLPFIQYGLYARFILVLGCVVQVVHVRKEVLGLRWRDTLGLRFLINVLRHVEPAH